MKHYFLFAGGPGQQAHLAPTYAAVNALCILGTEEAYNVIDRSEHLTSLLPRHHFLSSMGSYAKQWYKLHLLPSVVCIIAGGTSVLFRVAQTKRYAGLHDNVTCDLRD